MRLLQFIAASLVATLIHATSGGAATGVVQRNTNLRPTASTEEAPVELLQPATSLDILDSTPQNGFLHVKTPDGKEGWAWARNVRLEGGRAAALAPRRAEGRAPQPLAKRAAAAKARASAACFTTLAICPESGCETPDSPHGLLNRQKHTLPADGTPKLLTFQNLTALQTATDGLGIQQGVDVADRTKLHSINFGAGTVGEGDLVEVRGFIAPARTLSPAGAESVNCRISGPANNDIHVPIVETADDTEFHSIVVEPIPQHRDPAWTLAALQRLQSQGTLLLIRGQLLYDNLHRVNDDPAHGAGNQPKRFTLWEVHPVTHILTCSQPGNDCDPAAADQWSELGGQ